MAKHRLLHIEDMIGPLWAEVHSDVINIDCIIPLDTDKSSVSIPSIMSMYFTYTAGGQVFITATALHGHVKH